MTQSLIACAMLGRPGPRFWNRSALRAAAGMNSSSKSGRCTRPTFWPWFRSMAMACAHLLPPLPPPQQLVLLSPPPPLPLPLPQHRLQSRRREMATEREFGGRLGLKAPIPILHSSCLHSIARHVLDWPGSTDRLRLRGPGWTVPLVDDRRLQTRPPGRLQVTCWSAMHRG
jgi:hypothetical protein